MKCTLKPKKPVKYEAIQLRKEVTFFIDGTEYVAKSGDWFVVGDDGSQAVYTKELFDSTFELTPAVSIKKLN